jgi:hypothetical protein
MKSRCTEEAHRPAEWLLRFEENRHRYLELLEESGSLAVAAYRLARARCRVQPVSCAVPTSSELWSAARRIATHTGTLPDTPSGSRLMEECESKGLVGARALRQTG